MMRSTKQFLLLCLYLPVLFIAGCRKAPAAEEVPLDYRHITWQTDVVKSVGVRSMSDGTFYVEHTNEDGTKVYYELGTPAYGENSLYYSAGHEDIPTLFLAQGDRLIYHSYTELLSDIFFTRLEDLGYTIGICNISSLENGRCYLSTGMDHILPLCNDAGFLEEQEAENILIDEMGMILPSGYVFGVPEEGRNTCSLDDGILSFYDGLTLTTTRTVADYDMSGFNEEEPDLAGIRYPKLTSEVLQKGTLYGLKKNEKYHLEYYSGTYYATSDMTANIHIYSPKEYYHTNRYSLLQSTLFEIQLPELGNGIYSVSTVLGGEQKTFRLINESEFSIDDTFDEFLFPEGVYGITSETETYNQLYIKSDIEDGTLLTDIEADSCGNYYFRYETEDDRTDTDNGISWYYRGSAPEGKDGVILGRILNRHADFFSGVQQHMDEASDEILITVVELPEARYIVRYFGVTGIPFDTPLPENTYMQPFSVANVLFLHGSGLFLTPEPDTCGVLLLNAAAETSGQSGEDATPREDAEHRKDTECEGTRSAEGKE